MSALPVTLGGQIALVLYVWPLVAAAISDYRALRVPNWLTATLACLFPVAALLLGHDVNWLSHIAAGLIVLVAGAAMFHFGLMGGGDVKLLAAASLWMGLGQVVGFLFAVALIGGVFSLLVLVLRNVLMQGMLLTVFGRVPHVTARGASIPYGIPIAIGGILMAPTLPFIA